MHETHRNLSSIVNASTTAEIPFMGATLPVGTHITFMVHYISSNKVCPSKYVPIEPNGEPPHVFCPARYLVHQEDGSVTCPDRDRTGGAYSAFGFGFENVSRSRLCRNAYLYCTRQFVAEQ